MLTQRMICMGFSHWKKEYVTSMLSLASEQVHFVSLAQLEQMPQPSVQDCLVWWGGEPPPGVEALARRTGARTLRMEDGFIRSVGLGSNRIPPRSLAIDRQGIYFDPRRPSDLEVILNSAEFSAEELAEARRVLEFVVMHGMTKYNLEPRQTPAWKIGNRHVVLVPGQVEDDASIRLGAGAVRTNLGLLQAARTACPDALVVYKPHPDVLFGSRRGRLAMQEAMRWADHIETKCSVVSCLEACDEVHTMTSLTGFDALLRGKKVVVYGQPFYAGWGLTHDITPRDEAVAFQRRERRLTLDELVAGCLLRYPVYWDYQLNGYTTCMAVLQQLLDERTKLEVSGGLRKLHLDWGRRKWRKVRALWRAYFGKRT